jgi:hypothetical protein
LKVSKRKKKKSMLTHVAWQYPELAPSLVEAAAEPEDMTVESDQGTEDDKKYDSLYVIRNLQTG